MATNYSSPEQLVAAHYAEAVSWRRLMHACPQPSWMEFFSTALVAEKLSEWGYEIQMGRDVVEADKLLLLPDSEKLEEEYQRALKAGAKEKYLVPARGGFTGVVATLKGSKPGPVVGFRFDIDSNEVEESKDSDHLPAQQGFASQNPGYMHACGHDAHTAIGLLLARCLVDSKADLCGTVKLIFQPNEENLSGAAAMIGKGVVDDLDYLFAGHVGVGMGKEGQISLDVRGFFAMTRFEVTFTGRSAHAAGNPEYGKNALQGACAAVSNLLAIARNAQGGTRVNVGTIQAGTTWNVIPEKAYFRMETRGETNAANEYMVKRTYEIIEGAAKMHDLQYEIKPAAVCFGGQNSPEMIALAQQVAQELPSVKESIPKFSLSGSEDFTVFMDRVQKRGGQALFAVFGTPTYGGQHNSKFNIDEKVIANAAEFLLAMQRAVATAKEG